MSSSDQSPLISSVSKELLTPRIILPGRCGLCGLRGLWGLVNQKDRNGWSTYLPPKVPRV